MRFFPTELPGVVVIEREPREDERGYFARAYCAAEQTAHGLASHVAQVNLSFNAAAGTLRGLHFQAHPHGEAKTVTVLRGSVFDVAVDVRRGSPTFLRWVGVELTDRNHRALHVPVGFAHGFLTLEADSLVQYFVSSPYAPGFEHTVRWDDPRVGIVWPRQPTVLSPKDAGAALLTDAPSWPDFPLA